VALVRAAVSEERIASIIRVKIINELGKTLPADVVVSSFHISTLRMGAILFSEMSFLQKPHDDTYQKTAFFLVTDVKTSNLT
jgi:hypothetical protein